MRRVARDCEWTIVERMNPFQHLRERTNVAIVALLLGQLEIVQPGRDIAMNQHALHDFALLREVLGSARNSAARAPAVDIAVVPW